MKAKKTATMKKFRVQVTATPIVSTFLIVEARNEKEAEQKAKDAIIDADKTRWDWDGDVNIDEDGLDYDAEEVE